ncbi:MAG TPA: MotA/TolQ/ExbB proton channel family protein [bacterium]|nr:MotA/TolQ/ExbB proton channel family protein [bacterium]HPS29620.1 MotA/TolQ/ExbB proton channel family protein [bacterium]
MRYTTVLILAVFLFAGVQKLSAEGDIEQAYKKEFAFLEAEKRSLEQRLNDLDKESETRNSQGLSEISKLQDNLLQISSRADSLAEMLSMTERKNEAELNNIDSLESTVMQASATLQKYNITLPEKNGEKGITFSEQIDAAFQNSVKVLTEKSSVVFEPGQFFLEDGTKVNGTIVKVGNIAAYGVSEKGAGALVPAGNGFFKIWESNPTYDEAKMFSEGKAPGSLKIFIFENIDKGVELKKKKTFSEYTTSGGTLSWVIVGVGIVAMFLVLLRAVFLYISSATGEKLISRIDVLVSNGKIEDALKLCKASKGATSRVIRATLRNLEKEKEHLEDIISESILHENSYLDRFGNLILVLAAIAPLLGLLGTVTGMISTFDIITEYGNSDPKMLSGGISVALITTEFGLYVAIPALFFGNMLNGWAENIKGAMEKSALRMINCYEAFKSSAERSDG